MASNKIELNWQNVNPADMPDSLRATYDKIRAAKDAFEAEFIKAAQEANQLPEGKTIAFAYKRGLGVALKDAAAGQKPGAAFTFISAK